MRYRDIGVYWWHSFLRALSTLGTSPTGLSHWFPLWRRWWIINKLSFTNEQCWHLFLVVLIWHKLLIERVQLIETASPHTSLITELIYSGEIEIGGTNIAMLGFPHTGLLLILLILEQIAIQPLHLDLLRLRQSTCAKWNRSLSHVSLR